MNEDTSLITCSRCSRTRREKFMIQRKTRRGKTVWRCRARSVCASIGRRNRAKVQP